MKARTNDRAAMIAWHLPHFTSLLQRGAGRVTLWSALARKVRANRTPHATRRRDRRGLWLGKREERTIHRCARDRGFSFVICRPKAAEVTRCNDRANRLGIKRKISIKPPRFRLMTRSRRAMRGGHAAKCKRTAGCPRRPLPCHALDP